MTRTLNIVLSHMNTFQLMHSFDAFHRLSLLNVLNIDKNYTIFSVRA